LAQEDQEVAELELLELMMWPDLVEHLIPEAVVGEEDILLRRRYLFLQVEEEDLG
jgi:hypothetical protein